MRADGPLKAQGVAAFIDNNNNGGDFTAFPLGEPLPVELVDFFAASDGGRLRFSWRTASETNNAGFRLEGRVAGASDWTAFGAVPSQAPAGQSTEVLSYAFVTDRLPAGRYEVRIAQTDLDGTVHLSPVEEVEIGVDGTYELTALGSRAVRLAVAEPQHATVRLFDVAGREVARLFDGTFDAPTTLALPTGLAAGMYLVRVEAERFSATRSVVVR